MAKISCRGWLVLWFLLSIAQVIGQRPPLDDSFCTMQKTLDVKFAADSTTHEGAAEEPLLEPKPSDHISEAYWTRVEQALREAALATPPPSTTIDASKVKDADDYKKVFEASETVTNADTPDAAAVVSGVNWEANTPEPPIGDHGGSSLTHKVPVVPYDMQIGARILYGLAEKNTETPPPTQEYVDSAFVAKCPMLMSGKEIWIRAPRCGETDGTWVDPASKRTVLRWRDNEQGGVTFALDSAVSGNGSVKYADLHERVTVESYEFDFKNCMGVTRLVVVEELVRMKHFSPVARSTQMDHIGGSTSATFYRYVIRDTSGQDIARTSLFRMNQDQVNFTTFHNELDGPVVATATRQGVWRKSGWRTCHGAVRGWDIKYSNDTGKTAPIAAATVGDIRVAAAAVITLMAFRDESDDKDGFQSVGQNQMYVTVLTRVLYILLAMLCGLFVAIIGQRAGLEKKLGRCFFRIESILMPKCQVKGVKAMEKALHARQLEAIGGSTM